MWTSGAGQRLKSKATKHASRGGARRRINRGKGRQVEAQRDHAVLIHAANAIGVKQPVTNYRRDRDDGIAHAGEGALERDEHRGHQRAEVPVEHVAMVGVHDAGARRVAPRQVVGRGGQPAEQARLEPHFTNLDEPVFARVNLPETVMGAPFQSRMPGGCALGVSFTKAM